MAACCYVLLYEMGFLSYICKQLLKILETRGTRDKEWKTQRRVDYLCQISQTELWQRVANFPDQNLAPEEAFAQIAKKEPYTVSNIVLKTLRKKKITSK